jgi:HSP20 family protein
LSRGAAHALRLRAVTCAASSKPWEVCHESDQESFQPLVDVPSGRRGMPRLDVRETETTFEIKADLPGVRKDDVKVAIDGPRVMIEGECQQANERREGEQVVYSERSTRRYQRSFGLPSEVKDSTAEARLEDGVLKLTLPKKAGGSARRLTIR